MKLDLLKKKYVNLVALLLFWIKVMIRFDNQIKLLKYYHLCNFSHFFTVNYIKKHDIIQTTKKKQPI